MTTKLTEEHLLEYMNHNFSLEDIFFDKFRIAIFLRWKQKSRNDKRLLL